MQVTHTGHPIIQIGAYDAYSSYYTGVVVLTSNERQTDYTAAVKAMEDQVYSFKRMCVKRQCMCQ